MRACAVVPGTALPASASGCVVLAALAPPLLLVRSRSGVWSQELPACSASGRLLRVTWGCGMRLWALICVSCCCCAAWAACCCCWPLGTLVGDLYVGMREGTALTCRVGVTWVPHGIQQCNGPHVKLRLSRLCAQKRLIRGKLQEHMLLLHIQRVGQSR
jgi:hypothetical protein